MFDIPIYNNKKKIYIITNVTILPGTNIFLNTDDLCPYQGLLQKFAYDKNIL